MESEKLSVNHKSYIDYIKAFACILIVLHHAVSYFIKAYDSFPAGSRITGTVELIHVPLFFMVAGYLCHKQPLKKYFSKKFFRVLLPFLFFTTLKLLYSTLVSDEFAHSASTGGQLMMGYVFGDLYWFTYCMCLMYIAAPLLWIETKIKEKNVPLCAIIIFVVFILFSALNGKFHFAHIPNYFQFSRFILYMPYFALGFLIRYIPSDLLGKIRKRGVLTAAAAVSLAVAVVIFIFDATSPYLMKLLFSVSVGVVVYAVSFMLPQNIKPLKIIGKYSYQVFFLDSFYKIIVYKIAFKLLPDSFLSSSVGFITIFAACAVTIVLSCATCVVVRKIPIVKTLFGL